MTDCFVEAYQIEPQAQKFVLLHRVPHREQSIVTVETGVWRHLLPWQPDCDSL